MGIVDWNTIAPVMGPEASASLPREPRRSCSPSRAARPRAGQDQREDQRLDARLGDAALDGGGRCADDRAEADEELAATIRPRGIVPARSAAEAERSDLVDRLHLAAAQERAPASTHAITKTRISGIWSALEVDRADRDAEREEDQEEDEVTLQRRGVRGRARSRLLRQDQGRRADEGHRDRREQKGAR